MFKKQFSDLEDACALAQNFRSPTTELANPMAFFAQPKTGLGTAIVKALAKQLDSQVVALSGPKGTTVSVTHATFAGREERLEAVN